MWWRYKGSFTFYHFELFVQQLPGDDQPSRINILVLNALLYPIIRKDIVTFVEGVNTFFLLSYLTRDLLNFRSRDSMCRFLYLNLVWTLVLYILENFSTGNYKLFSMWFYSIVNVWFWYQLLNIYWESNMF